MATSRVTRGRHSQKLLAQWLVGHGWAGAESVPASLPGRDILGTPGLAIEVKATKVADLPGAMRQAVKNAKGDLAVVVYRPAGYGPERMADWLCVFSLRDATELLTAAGYGGETKEQAA